MSSSLLSLRDFCGLATLAGQHKLIFFRIDAHREMWRLIPFRLWLALQLTAASRHFPPARDNVRYLKAQTRPGPLSFPAAVDADCRSAHDHLTHHLRLLDHLTAENVAVKLHRTPHVSRPDEILHSLYLHFPMLSTMSARRQSFFDFAMPEARCCTGDWTLAGASLRISGRYTIADRHRYGSVRVAPRTS